MQAGHGSEVVQWLPPPWTSWRSGGATQSETRTSDESAESETACKWETTREFCWGECGLLFTVVAVNVAGAAGGAAGRGWVSRATLRASQVAVALTIVIAISGANWARSDVGAMAAATVDQGKRDRANAVVVAVNVAGAARDAAGRRALAVGALVAKDRKRKAVS